MTWDDPLIRVYGWCAAICLALGVSGLLGLRLPYRTRRSLEAPEAGEADLVWERFGRSARTLEQLLSGVPLGLVLLTAALGAEGVRESPWALVVVIVAVAFAALWVNPGLVRERTFVRRLLETRGAPAAELDAADYIEIWEGEPAEPDREPWDALGFVAFGDDGVTLYTPIERISIPRSAVEEIARETGGVHPLGIAWEIPSGAKRTVFFVSRNGEHRAAHGRAQRDLAARLARWHETTAGAGSPPASPTASPPASPTA